MPTSRRAEREYAPVAADVVHKDERRFEAEKP